VKRKIVAVTLAVLLSGNVNGQTLTEAVQLTLTTNPDILATEHNLTAAEALLRQARAGYFPSLDLVLAGGRENSNNTTTRAANLEDLRLDRQESSLRLTQMIYDGSATRNFVRQQSALVDAALLRLAGSHETVGLRAIQVYLEVLRRKAVVGLANDNLRQHEETLLKIQERYDGGVGTKVDVVQTEGRRAQSKSNVLLSQRDEKNGEAQFFRVVGEQATDLMVPAEITGLPTTLEMAIETAFSNNPNLKAAQADLVAAQAAHKQASAAFKPRFDLELGATRNDDTDGSLGANDDETAVIRMSYNLYRGGADRARSNEVEAREFAARETVRSIQRQRGVREDVTLIWNELQDILLRLEYLQAHVASTEEVLVVYNEQLGLGKRTLLDLLDVQNELLRARVGLLTGQYAVLFARYRVLASGGGLMQGLGLDTAR
jgi:adhesin transport system outer membrane protein|tara:strand:- start:8600 stop:9895 length:1296 start_codon:yes stop_codon:yes gene_type:complete